jgi:hypothetical protein
MMTDTIKKETTVKTQPLVNAELGTCVYKNEQTNDWETKQCTKEQCDALDGTWTQP